ncbi:MAG TPA: adenine deaminase [Anaerolineae bacterium]|nr:adenine deaminase [Anaerolineae bacterium]
MNEINIKKISKRLVDVAMGREPADLVIRNGRWVCVQSGEIIPNTDIAIVDKRIAYVGSDASHTIGSKTNIVDAENDYLVPGLLDAHMHIESSMVTVTEFVKAVVPHGTTGIFVDPHEIANVFGLKGVKLMVDEALNQPIHVWVQMPSCVPSAPGFETPGATIGPEEVAEAMTWDGIIGLGEMMNFPGVYMSDDKMHAEMAETKAKGKVIGGHYASLDLGLPFHGYVAAGPEDDHEGTRIEDAIARVRQGMKPMLRYGSAWHDVANQIGAIIEKRLDSRHFILCTDDSHSETLVNDGHMDRVLRHAIKHGLKPITALQMCTINTAEHFGLAKDIGMIAPGRFADVLIVKDLNNFRAEKVYAKGRLIAENGLMLSELPTYSYPKWATNSINVGKNLTEEDFIIKTDILGTVTANVIGVIENQAPTKHLRMKMNAVNGKVSVDIERDIAKIALIERHHDTGRVQVGFVHGFRLNRECAIGSTVAHDSHQMIIVGTNEQNMAIAAHKLIEMQGGQVVILDGKNIGSVPLPIGGLMSCESAEKVAKQATTVLDGFKRCGCNLNNPNMQLSLLALVVIPELRLSDLGLVDVKNLQFLPVIEQ